MHFAPTPWCIGYNEGMIIIDEAFCRQAASYLAQHDAQLAPVIARAGLCKIVPHQDYYRALTRSIIGQQLSVKAAASIERQFRELFGGEFPLPATLLTKTVEELRPAGLSKQKASYIRDLAQHVVDGKVQFNHLDDMSNGEIIAELTDVKGVGEWTVHMFLMFCMGRPDVLAHGDLGIRNGIQKLYGLDQPPSPTQVQAIAKEHHWHPYETVACWYVWYSLDNKPM